MRVAQMTPLVLHYPEYPQSLHLNCELSFTNSGCTKVLKIWASYWILNLTNIPLLHFYEPEGKVPLAGQHIEEFDPVVSDKFGVLTYSSASKIMIKKWDCKDEPIHCVADFERANNTVALKYVLLLLIALFLNLLISVIWFLIYLLQVI
jgi:hypothetical protein